MAVDLFKKTVRNRTQSFFEVLSPLLVAFCLFVLMAVSPVSFSQDVAASSPAVAGGGDEASVEPQATGLSSLDSLITKAAPSHPLEKKVASWRKNINTLRAEAIELERVHAIAKDLYEPLMVDIVATIKEVTRSVTVESHQTKTEGVPVLEETIED